MKAILVPARVRTAFQSKSEQLFEIECAWHAALRFKAGPLRDIARAARRSENESRPRGIDGMAHRGHLGA